MRFFFAAALFAVLCQGRFPFGSPSTPALETTALSSARLMFPISNFRYPSTRRAGTPVKQTFWGTAPRRPTLAVMNSLRGGMQLMVLLALLRLGDVAPLSPLSLPAPGYTAAMVVPTGIGASIGGYAGDAMPAARALAAVADTLVTHPNVMNGAQMYWPQPNILYTEGYALDQWAAGKWGLKPMAARGHRIGIVLDAAIDGDMRTRHLQAANAARATLAIDVAEYIVTDEPLGVKLALSPSGASWGTLDRPDSLLRAAAHLVHACGCSAVAVVARFPDDEDEAMLEAYRHGAGVDAIGGAEAIISHLVTQELSVPCAHAPALPPLDVDPDVSPRACAEELGYTFLPCVLANLHRAPSILRHDEERQPGCVTLLSGALYRTNVPFFFLQWTETRSIWARDIDAVVVPTSACGGNSCIEALRIS